MSQLPYEQAGGLRIGTVDFVSPDHIRMVLDIEAPESIALNTGVPRPFPRVNGYLLVPVDDGLLVGQVEWITVEQSPFPKRRGMKDFGLVDLPYPLRKLRLNPLGMLRSPSVEGPTVFQRGADTLPSVGTAVIIPTEDQLRSIVESGEKQRVKIGSSPLAGDAEVSIDPDRLFGRHLAILGNTGSGKSCSVAGLVRWSLEQSAKKAAGRVNARFIILDPNGEYSRAFDNRGITAARVFKVGATKDSLTLKVPLWFWNSAEWCSFTQASPRTQRPALIQALRSCRDDRFELENDSIHGIRQYLRTLVSIIRIERRKGNPWGDFPKNKSFYERLETWRKGLEYKVDDLEDPHRATLYQLIGKFEELCQPQRVQFPTYNFPLQEVDELLNSVQSAYWALGGGSSDIESPDVDAPLPFDGVSLLRNLEAVAEMLNVTEHVATLLIRIRTLLTDTQMEPVMVGVADITLGQWLESYIGGGSDDEKCISIIDLSLVPSEVVHLIAAVIARMVFEALQRYVKLNGVSLPTVLVMEEAHTFIKRYRDSFDYQDAATVCCQVFEKIAREGRKFGLGLVLSSQRPSELSPAVLSQCNTFLLHRISNDRDQELVLRLVPDNLRGLLRELPSLPSQMALLLGWASELPVLVRMKDLPHDQQPRSDDPDFWKVWTGASERPIDWTSIVLDWQGGVDGGSADNPKMSCPDTDESESAVPEDVEYYEDEDVEYYEDEWRNNESPF